MAEMVIFHEQGISPHDNPAIHVDTRHPGLLEEPQNVNEQEFKTRLYTQWCTTGVSEKTEKMRSIPLICILKGAGF
jgi:hypothetical protein